MNTPNMLPELFDAIQNFTNDQDIQTDMYLFLSNLQSSQVDKIKAEAQSQLENMNRCTVCGHELATYTYREYHDELEEKPFEVMAEQYCPYCDGIVKEGD